MSPAARSAQHLSHPLLSHVSSLAEMCKAFSEKAVIWMRTCCFKTCRYLSICTSCQFHTHWCTSMPSEMQTLELRADNKANMWINMHATLIFDAAGIYQSQRKNLWPIRLWTANMPSVGLLTFFFFFFKSNYIHWHNSIATFMHEWKTLQFCVSHIKLQFIWWSIFMQKCD